MKKIVIFGLLYDRNLGDPLLFDCIEYLLKSNSDDEINIIRADIFDRENFDERGIIDNSNNIKKNIKNAIKRMLGSFLITKSKVKQVKKDLTSFYKKMIQSADLIVISGAGTIKWDIRCNFGSYYDAISQCADDMGIPCVVNSVGIESRYSDTDYRSFHFSEVLSRDVFKLIATRDDFNELKKYVRNENTFLAQMADSAVWVSDAYSIDRKKDPDIIGIGIITPNRFVEFKRGIDRNQYEKILVDIISKMKLKNQKIEIFTNGDIEDSFFAQYIHDTYCPTDNIIIPQTPRQLVEIISGYKAIVTSRLHSCIIAYSLDVPFVNLCWNKKIKYFCDNIRCLERCIETDRFCVESIILELTNAIARGYDSDLKKEYKATNEKIFKQYLKIADSSRKI